MFSPPRFNLFHALRLSDHEIRHSNMLAWLLDPAESHGQRATFLREFLAIADSSLASEQFWIEDNHDLDTVMVSREVDGLDVRVVIPHLRLVLAIENKLFTCEHSDQLTRYSASLESDFPGWRHLCFLLSLDGDCPTNAGWRALTHEQVVASVRECLRRRSETVPAAVSVFIEQYVELFDDIYSRRSRLKSAPRMSDVMHTIRSAVEQRPGWVVIAATPVLLECGPKALLDRLPPIAQQKDRDPQHWLTLRFQDHGARGYVGRYWRPAPVTDRVRRNTVLRGLLSESGATGFKYKNGPVERALELEAPAMSGDRIQDLRTGQVPTPRLLSELVKNELQAVEARMPAILRVLSQGAVSESLAR